MQQGKWLSEEALQIAEKRRDAKDKGKGIPFRVWELDYKESWALKNECFWTVVLEKTFESPLDCKEIKGVYPKGNQSWIFFGRSDVEAETPILWPPDGKNWLFEKDSDAWKDWRLEEKGMAEDEMVGWHHWLNGHEFEQAPGVGDGQGGLLCYSPWGYKESDRTEWLNWTELYCELLKSLDSFPGSVHPHFGDQESESAGGSPGILEWREIGGWYQGFQEHPKNKSHVWSQGALNDIKRQNIFSWHIS